MSETLEQRAEKIMKASLKIGMNTLTPDEVRTAANDLEELVLAELRDALKERDREWFNAACTNERNVDHMVYNGKPTCKGYSNCVKDGRNGKYFEVWESGSIGCYIKYNERHTRGFNPDLPESVAWYAQALGVSEGEILQAVGVWKRENPPTCQRCHGVHFMSAKLGCCDLGKRELQVQDDS